MQNPSEELEPIQTERLPKPQRNQRLELTTIDFGFEGKAVARREDGYVVFVEGALGNEKVIAEVFKAKGRFAEAKLVEILEPSPDRIEPVCPYFGVCGGCSLQHMAYDRQLVAKQKHVADLLERIGGFTDAVVHPTLGNPERQFRYRNKMEYSFSEERWLTEDEINSDDALDRFAVGLHVRNRFNRVIDAKVCFLPSQISVDVLSFTREFAIQNELRVFDPDKTPDGILRFLVVRTSHHSEDVMVNLVTAHRDDELLEQYTEELLAALPGVTTVVNNINGRRAQVAVGDEEILYHGPGYITDSIGGIPYQISANSFFQTNTRQAEVLYQTALDLLAPNREDNLWDLYCGAGTISLFVAGRVKHVTGIELIEQAIRDAEANAKANNVDNVVFVASDLKTALTTPEFLSEHPRPDVMIIDPPRSGMHQEVIREILVLAPREIVYISCNPATQARDLALMSEGYELIEVQPVDMFPQTWHIESVAKLRRR